MKDFIKRWLHITPSDIIADECNCCDEYLTQEEINFMLRDDIERLTPKKKIKVKSE